MYQQIVQVVRLCTKSSLVNLHQVEMDGIKIKVENAVVRLRTQARELIKGITRRQLKQLTNE